METTSHEGMCDLTPYADEDVSDIVSKEGWVKDPAPWQTNLF
jgi:hypothetical protein